MYQSFAGTMLGAFNFIFFMNGCQRRAIEMLTSTIEDNDPTTLYMRKGMW